MRATCNRKSQVKKQPLPHFHNLPIKATLKAHVLNNVISAHPRIIRCRFPFHYSEFQRQYNRLESLIPWCHVAGPFPGLQQGVEDHLTEDLHSLTWLQRGDLITLTPIDRDVKESDYANDRKSHFGFFSYAQMAFLAIEAVPRKACTLMEIVFWCMQNFPDEISVDSWKLHMKHILMSDQAFSLQTFKSFSNGVHHYDSLWTCVPEHRDHLLQSLRHIMQQRNYTVPPGVENLLQSFR